MNNDILNQINRLKAIASELELALKHSTVAVDHFQNSEVPRACAHTLALEGHLIIATDLLKEIAKFHSSKAAIN